MGSIFLKLFNIDTLIEFVIALLASTVKNPHSDKARRLRGIVAKLHEATGSFLNKVPF